MSIDRYMAICRPLSIGSLTSRPRKMIIISWIMAIIFAFPQLFIFKQHATGIYPDGFIKYECASKGYTAPWQRKTYFTAFTTYILIFPVCIISFCYINVVKTLWSREKKDMRSFDCSFDNETQMKQSRLLKKNVKDVDIELVSKIDPSTKRIEFNCKQISKRHDLRSQNNSTERQDLKCCIFRKCCSKKTNKFSTNNEDCNMKCENLKQVKSSTFGSNLTMGRAKIKTIKMTLCIICVFIICWTPYFVVNLIRVWSEYKLFIPKEILAFSQTIAFLNSALNPIIYGFFNIKVINRKKKSSHNPSLGNSESINKDESMNNTKRIRTNFCIRNNPHKNSDLTSNRLKNNFELSNSRSLKSDEVYVSERQKRVSFSEKNKFNSKNNSQIINVVDRTKQNCSIDSSDDRTIINYKSNDLVLNNFQSNDNSEFDKTECNRSSFSNNQSTFNSQKSTQVLATKNENIFKRCILSKIRTDYKMNNEGQINNYQKSSIITNKKLITSISPDLKRKKYVQVVDLHNFKYKIKFSNKNSNYETNFNDPVKI